MSFCGVYLGAHAGIAAYLSGAFAVVDEVVTETVDNPLFLPAKNGIAAAAARNASTAADAKTAHRHQAIRSSSDGLRFKLPLAKSAMIASLCR